jgi:hypothetical protein
MSSSTSRDIIFARDVDPTKLLFSSPKQMDNGARNIYINYQHTNNNLIIQTPTLNAPFGISTWPGDRSSPDKYTLDLSFAGRDTNPGIQEFYDMLQNISNFVLDSALENSNTWFKKKYPSRDVIEAIFNSNIRYSKDKVTGEVSNAYPPTFKLNLPYRDNTFSFPCYGAKRESVNLFDIINQPSRGKGARVTAIMQLNSLWVVGGKFGLTWRVNQLRIVLPQISSGYAFVPIDDDDDNDNSSINKNGCDDDDAQENAHLFM